MIPGRGTGAWSRVLPVVLLAVLVGAAYQPVWHADFVDFDDDKYVRDNPYVLAGLEAESLAWAWRDTELTSNWHPVTWWSLMLDAELGGPGPRVFHVTNVVLHAASTLLLFLLLGSLRRPLGVRLLVAALFAVHPLHVESVAWISERKDVLSTLFWLLTMLAWVRYTETSRWRWYALAAAAMGLGLMAKPMLVSLPLVLVLLDLWPLDRVARPWRSPRNLRLLGEKAPLALLALGAVLTTLLAQSSGGAMGSLPWSLRLGNACLSVFRYLGRMVWPEGLAFFYPFPEALSSVAVAAAVLAIAGVSALAAALARRHPWLLVGWAWYLITLLPVLGIVQVGGQAMADRYTYVPLVGIFLILAEGGARLLARAGAGAPARWLVGALVVAALLVPCRQQVAVWRDSGTLFRHALEHTEGNFLAHTNLAVHLQRQGDVARAEGHLREALEIAPTYPFANFALGALLVNRAGAADTKEERQRHARQALQLLERGGAEQVGDPKALNAKGVALAMLGDFGEARRLLELALQRAPQDRNIRDNLDRVRAAQGG